MRESLFYACNTTFISTNRRRGIVTLWFDIFIWTQNWCKEHKLGPPIHIEFFPPNHTIYLVHLIRVQWNTFSINMKNKGNYCYSFLLSIALKSVWTRSDAQAVLFLMNTWILNCSDRLQRLQFCLIPFFLAIGLIHRIVTDRHLVDPNQNEWTNKNVCSYVAIRLKRQ